MKLCPQCAFIYEDQQRFCDMDGNVLVADPASRAAPSSVAPPTRLTISIPIRSEARPAPARVQSRRFPVLIAVGAVIATLLAVLYFVQLYRSRSSNALEPSRQPPARSAAPNPSAESAPVDLVSPSSVAVSPLDEQLPAESPKDSLTSPTNATGSASSLPQSSQSPAIATSLARARLASTPVSAGAVTANTRGAVRVRLTNGATINADEAWEKSEGVWYRQAGMVTFLKRSRVRTIERLAPPQPQAKSSPNNSEEKHQKSEIRAAQNPLRIRRLEAADTKKPSRVSSFLKMTGRMLKKPFKL